MCDELSGMRKLPILCFQFLDLLSQVVGLRSRVSATVEVAVSLQVTGLLQLAGILILERFHWISSQPVQHCVFRFVSRSCFCVRRADEHVSRRAWELRWHFVRQDRLDSATGQWRPLVAYGAGPSVRRDNRIPVNSLQRSRRTMRGDVGGGEFSGAMPHSSGVFLPVRGQGTSGVRLSSSLKNRIHFGHTGRSCSRGPRM